MAKQKSTPRQQIQMGRAQANLSRGKTQFGNLFPKPTKSDRAILKQLGADAASNLIKGTIRKNRAKVK